MLALPALPALPAEGDLRGSPGTGAWPALHRVMQPTETATKLPVSSAAARLQKE